MRLILIIFLLTFFSCNSKTEIRVIQDEICESENNSSYISPEYSPTLINDDQIMLLISPELDFKQNGDVVTLKKHQGFDWWSKKDRIWKELVVNKIVKIEYEDILFHIEDNEFKYLSISFDLNSNLLLYYEKYPPPPDE